MKYCAVIVLLASALACMAGQAQNRNAYGKRGVAPSVIGGAVNLDGGSEYFTQAGSLLSGKTKFSISLWAKSVGYSSASYEGIFGCRNGNEQTVQMLIYASEPRFQGYVIGSDANAYYYSSSSITIASNTWYHLVLVKTSSNLVFYVNGSPQSTNATITATTRNTTTTTVIGWDNSSTTERRFGGLIDDVAVFSERDLVPSEVSAIYNAGLGAPATVVNTNGLVRYWKLDDGLTNPASTNAIDYFGNVAVGTGVGLGDWTNGICPQ